MHDRDLANIKVELVSKFRQKEDSKKIKNARLAEDQKSSDEEVRLNQDRLKKKKIIDDKIGKIAASVKLASVVILHLLNGLFDTKSPRRFFDKVKETDHKIDVAEMIEKIGVILDVESYDTAEKIKKLKSDDFEMIENNLRKLITFAETIKDRSSSSALMGVSEVFYGLDLLKKINDIERESEALKKIEEEANIKIKDIRVEKIRRDEARMEQDKGRVREGVGVAMQAVNENIKKKTESFSENIKQKFDSLSNKKKLIITELEQDEICLKLGKEKCAIICSGIDGEISSLEGKKDQLITELDRLKDSFDFDKEGDIDDRMNAIKILFTSFDKECAVAEEKLNESIPEFLVAKADMQIVSKEYEILTKNLQEDLKYEYVFHVNLQEDVNEVGHKIDNLLAHVNRLENSVEKSRFNEIKRSILSLKNNFEKNILPYMMDFIFFKIENAISCGHIDAEIIKKLFDDSCNAINQLRPDEKKAGQFNEKLKAYEKLCGFLICIQENFSLSYSDIIEEDTRVFFDHHNPNEVLKKLIISSVKKINLDRIDDQFNEIEEKFNTVDLVKKKYFLKQADILLNGVKKLEVKLTDSPLSEDADIGNILDKLKLFTFREKFLDLSFEFNKLKKSKNLILLSNLLGRINQSIGEMISFSNDKELSSTVILNNFSAMKNEVSKLLENGINNQVEELTRLIKKFDQSTGYYLDDDLKISSIVNNIDDYIFSLKNDTEMLKTVKPYIEKYQPLKDKLTWWTEIFPEKIYNYIEESLSIKVNTQGFFRGMLAQFRDISNSNKNLMQLALDSTEKPNIVASLKKCPKIGSLQELIITHQKVKAVAICDQEIARLSLEKDKEAKSKQHAFVALKNEINNHFSDLSMTLEKIIQTNQTRYITNNGQFCDDINGEGVYKNHSGKADTFIDIIGRNRSWLSNDKSRVTSFKAVNQMLAMSPPHAVIDAIISEASEMNCFTSLYLDCDVITTPEAQARFILNFELQLYKLGYKQFHVCCPANDKQTLAMEKIGDFSGFTTTVHGSNQAAMLVAKKKLLWTDKKYACLQERDQIIPIATYKQTITGKKEIDNNTLKNNLQRISTVLNSSLPTVVIYLVSKGGLNNDLKIETPAIGGGEFSLSTSQNKLIKDKIREHENEYFHTPSSAKINSCKNKLYEKKYKMNIKDKQKEDRDRDRFEHLLRDIENKINEKSKEFNILSVSSDYKINMLKKLKEALEKNSKENRKQTVGHVIKQWRNSKEPLPSKNDERIKAWKEWKIVVTDNRTSLKDMKIEPKSIYIQRNCTFLYRGEKYTNELMAYWLEDGQIISKSIKRSAANNLVEKLDKLPEDVQLKKRDDNSEHDQDLIDEIKFIHGCGAPRATCDELIQVPRHFLSSFKQSQRTDTAEFIGQLTRRYGDLLLCDSLIQKEELCRWQCRVN